MKALVGRDPELAAVDARLDALDGPAVVVVAGEPGIGKSHLLAELGRRADARGMLVLNGSASEFEQDLPFWLFVDALDEYLRATRPAGLDDDLALLLPSWPATAGPASSGDPRYRAHRAVRKVLEVLAQETPVVLLLDDLHWADEGSIELICALLRRPPAAKVLLGLAMRPRQAPGRLATALDRTGTVRLDLVPLGLHDVREMVGPEADAAGLHAESGGNPYFLTQLVRGAGAGGADELARLDRDVRRVLEAAAVAGDPFLLDLAAVAAGREVTEALDVLLERDLVRPTEAPRRFRFRHPLLRKAVYEAAPRAWRLGAHERLAREPGLSPSARAHHVVQAARPGDAEAVRLLRSVGDDAAARAPGEAARWYRHALDLQPSDPALWVALGSAQGAAGDLEEAHHSLVRALELIGTAEARVPVVAACAGIENTLGRHDAAHRRLTTALDALGDEHPAESAALMTGIAQDHQFRLEFEQAVHWARRAREAAGRSGNRVAMADSAMRLAFSAAFAGDGEVAAAACAESAALLDTLTDAEIGLSPDPIVAQLAAAELLSGRLADAERHAERSLAVVRHHVPVMFWAGLVRAALGRLPEAAALLDEAIEVARSSGHGSLLGWALVARSSVALDCGDRAAARALAEESVRAHQAPERSLPGVWSRLVLAASGELEAAERTIGIDLDLLPAPLRASARALVEQARIARGDLTGAEPTAAIRLAQGHPREAAELALAAAASGTVLEEAAARFLAARALASSGDVEAAVHQLQLVCEIYERCGAPRRRAEAERLLRKLGHRVHRRSEPGALAGLTGRELQIARLITDRRTNAEIAAELFLSLKTVETHIRHVFQKLSVTSRVEVARAVERLDQGAAPMS
ncbi:AAA family ATPase [Actinoplanes bogorensis]|uniref:AAA family ATPase n=1 Tax=Paractinoplanes bogorensis TaxID=1610840 RepID=A0ABS5YVR2_9ACTN|nr:LuxR family transcriptional regulator [Actinoplanes bogorensis]MBU2666195.1 AAA family ATPase [Actinoplanes bogorensis]